MSPGIEVGTPSIVKLDDGRTEWSVAVGGSGLPERLWYTIPSGFDEMLTDRADPAVVALIMPALEAGASVSVEGVVTDELAFNYDSVQSLYSATGGGVPSGLRVKLREPARVHGPWVATGFSAGIDSFHSLAEHYFSESVPNALRVTHLLFNNVGSHGWDERAGRLGEERLNSLRKVVDPIGLPLIDVQSNVDEFYTGSLWYYQTHTARNASVAHLLSSGLRTWLYASAYDYRHIGVFRNAPSAGFVDPIVLPLLSTSVLDLRDSGTRLRRVDKTSIVAEMPLAWDSLDVCSDLAAVGGEQCSECMKCRRTLMALDILGHLDRFESRFDLERWWTARDDYILQVLAARAGADPFLLELRELMRERGFRIPRSVVARAPGFIVGSLQSWSRTRAKRLRGTASRVREWLVG